MTEITIARIYLTEGQHLLKQLITKLHDQEKVRGVTVFRGISGFGHSGRVHSASLLDLSMDLPLVVEFFDLPERVEAILEDLESTLSNVAVVSWQAKASHFSLV
jgi:PII-like signaling protein